MVYSASHSDPFLSAKLEIHYAPYIRKQARGHTFKFISYISDKNWNTVSELQQIIHTTHYIQTKVSILNKYFWIFYFKCNRGKCGFSTCRQYCEINSQFVSEEQGQSSGNCISKLNEKWVQMSSEAKVCQRDHIINSHSTLSFSWMTVLH